MELDFKDFRDTNWRELVSKVRLELTNQLQKAWSVGDILVEVSSKYGEHTIKKFCEEVGLGISTAYSYRKLADMFPKKNREKMLEKYTNLSFGHYSLFANKEGLNESEIDGYLTNADENKLSIRGLKNLIEQDNPTATEDKHFVKVIMPQSLLPQFIECRELAIELLGFTDVNAEDVNKNPLVLEKIVVEALHSLQQEVEMLKNANTVE